MMYWSYRDIEAQKPNAVDINDAYPPIHTQHLNSPSPVDARIPLNFRTLSTHVETKVNETGRGKENASRKQAVKS